MNNTATIKLDPPLKWAGGKRWLVEPFCGGLSVALEIRPARALLNDINQHLINFYHHIENETFPKIEQRNESEWFYACRERFNKHVLPDSPEAAALFYYLNRTGYNGLCRFNKSGGFNVPFGKYSKVHYDQDFTAYARAFENWFFKCGDFTALSLEKYDFVYCDPPYDCEFTSYSPGGFSWEDQVRLLEWLEPHKGPIMISNQASERIIQLYLQKGYVLEKVSEPRRISCTGDRKPANTVLAYRNIL